MLAMANVGATGTDFHGYETTCAQSHLQNCPLSL